MEKVAKSGIKVAILRVHQRYGVDSSFEHNYKGCKQNGILAGAYKYSYALTPAQAVEEAENVIEVLNGRGLDFPVFYDLEWKQQRSLGKQAIENIAVSFLTRIKKQDIRLASIAIWTGIIITCPTTSRNTICGLQDMRIMTTGLFQNGSDRLLVSAGSIQRVEK